MLPRVLEPEVMDTAEEAADYDAMDHADVNRVFVDDFLRTLAPLRRPENGRWRIFDAGTGTALIPIELAGRGVPVEVVAADAAEHMLTLARRNVSAAGCADCIWLMWRDCKALPEASDSFDAVMSNSIVHHIPEPRDVLAECWPILRPGGLLFVRDLLRPADGATVEQLVRQYAGAANARQQQLFRQSLHAALTVDEVRQLLAEWKIAPECACATSDRHWTVSAVKAR